MKIIGAFGWLILICVIAFVALPLMDNSLPRGWRIALAVVFSAALLRWGPRSPKNHLIRWGLMCSGGVFLTILLNNLASRGGVAKEDVQGTVASFTAIGVAIVLFLTVSRPNLVGALPTRLRRLTVTSIMIFAALINWASHAAIATMKRGDFYIVGSALWVNFIVLPHPYDYYLVMSWLPISVGISFVAMLIFALMYFVVFVRENRRRRI